MRFIIITLLCILPAIILAQDSSPFTVDDTVALAIRNNPRLSAAMRDITAARLGVRSAKALANPQIIFTPGITGLAGTDEELLVQQPLELNGTRAARTGIAQARLQQTQAETVVELRNLVFTTKSAYYNLVRAREQLTLMRDLLMTTEEVARFTRRQVELGSRPGIDQIQTDIEVSRARQQVLIAEGEASAAQASLNTLLGRAPDISVGLLSPLTYRPTSVDRALSVQQALSSRAEIAAEQAAGNAFRQESRLTRAQGMPDLTPQFRAGSVVRKFSDYGVGLAITLPLFDYGSRRDRVHQAEESAHAQEERATAARNQARQEVEQALDRLHAADMALKEYDQGLLENSRRLLEASRIGFQVGQTSILTLLEAQRTYRTVQSEHINALVNYNLALTELERATGAVSSSLVPGATTLRGTK